MLGFRNSIFQLSRYIGVGTINSIVGFATIFALMYLGIAPWIANASGYLVGLFLGFFLSRRFVFFSNGQLAREGILYLLSFIISFTANLLALNFMLRHLLMNAIVAQFISTAIYAISMYLLCQLLVFNIRKS